MPSTIFSVVPWCVGIGRFYCIILPKKECKNLLLARQNHSAVQELIKQDCEKGYLYGPFDQPPPESYKVSPLGLAIWKYSGKKHLIVDLSSPHDDPLHIRLSIRG